MFEGIRVLELGTWVMVPAAATVLADFGAEVIKVEHPRTGDPGRGLVTGGVSPKAGTVTLFTEQVNRGKRSVGLDVSSSEGREVLYKLASTCDVFVTSFLPDARRKHQIDVEHIRAHNPEIVYVRADAVGVRGPESGKPGYDFSVFWGRSGFLDAVSGPHAEHPSFPRPGFGDKTAAMNIAFGIAAALLRRERTGQTAVVDVSLLGSAVWSNSSDLIYSAGLGKDFTLVERPNTNPISGTFRTADGHWLTLTMLESDRWWPELCRRMGRDDLLTDERFIDAAARARNNEACAAEIVETFGGATLAEWRQRFDGMRAPWEVVQSQMEVLEDPQVVANDYVTTVEHPSGATLRLVPPPVQFDGAPPALGHAPEVGADTEAVLLELGYDWDDLVRYKDLGAIT
jgi:crotonobetainyl-CoA:carnitine CoA-transferase CaiB-like acyl-CoA transferase